MLVSQFINSKGKSVKNHFIVTDGNRISFQSYNSIVCEIYDKPCLGFEKVVKFGKDWNYGSTTSRHRNDFMIQCGLDILANTKAIKEAIERGYARLNESIAVVYDETL